MGALVMLKIVTLHSIFLVSGENSKMWVFFVYNVAVDLSKDDGECLEMVCSDTLNSISSLFSASKEKVGKAMVQVIFSLCPKHLTYFIYCLMLKRDTSREGT